MIPLLPIRSRHALASRAASFNAIIALRYFTVRQRQSPSGYETLIQISNPTGIKTGTMFLLFFNTRVVAIASLEVKWGAAGSGSDTASISVTEEVPMGKPLTIRAGGSLQPAQVKCVDRFDPKP